MHLMMPGVAAAGSGCDGCSGRDQHRRASLRHRSLFTAVIGRCSQCALVSVDRATVSRAREKCRPPPHDGQVLSDGEQPARPRAASFAQRSCFHLASTAKAHGSNFQDDLEEIDQVQRLTGAPEEIRTPDPQIRSLGRPMSDAGLVRLCPCPATGRRMTA